MGAAKEPGEIRLLYKDPRGSVIPPLWEGDGGMLANNETTMSEQVIMPFINSPIFKEDDQLIVWFKPILADTVELQDSATGADISKIQIPVTIRNVRTGVISRTYLRTEDFAFVNGNTQGQGSGALTAGNGIELLKHTISAGEELKLGHRYAFNSRLMISIYDDT